jgi:hypothetical protein
MVGLIGAFFRPPTRKSAVILRIGLDGGSPRVALKVIQIPETAWEIGRLVMNW